VRRGRTSCHPNYRCAQVAATIRIDSTRNRAAFVTLAAAWLAVLDAVVAAEPVDEVVPLPGADGVVPDVFAPDVPAPDAPAPDAPGPDVPAPDVLDGPAPDVIAAAGSMRPVT